MPWGIWFHFTINITALFTIILIRFDVVKLENWCSITVFYVFFSFIWLISWFWPAKAVVTTLFRIARDSIASNVLLPILTLTLSGLLSNERTTSKTTHIQTDNINPGYNFERVSVGDNMYPICVDSQTQIHWFMFCQTFFVVFFFLVAVMFASVFRVSHWCHFEAQANWNELSIRFCTFHLFWQFGCKMWLSPI